MSAIPVSFYEKKAVKRMVGFII